MIIRPLALSRKLPTLRVVRMKMKIVLVCLPLAYRWGLIGFVGGELLRVFT